MRLSNLKVGMILFNIHTRQCEEIILITQHNFQSDRFYTKYGHSSENKGPIFSTAHYREATKQEILEHKLTYAPEI